MWPQSPPPLRRGRIFITNGVRVLPFLRRRVRRQDVVRHGSLTKKKGRGKRREKGTWGETISRKCSWNVVLRGDGAAAFIADASFRFDGHAGLLGHSRFLRGEERKRVCAEVTRERSPHMW